MLDEIRENENEQTFDVDRESVSSSSSPPDLSDGATHDFEQKRQQQGSPIREKEKLCFISDKYNGFQLCGDQLVHQNPDQERYPHQFQRRIISPYDVISFNSLCYPHYI